MAEKINPALSGLTVSIESLRLDPKNARKHGKKSIDALKQYLEEYGQQKPIVALQDGTIIAGNGLLQAAEELGWEKIAVIVFDSQEKAKAKEYALADNRSAELSNWDTDILKVLKDELNLKEIAGFDARFLKKMAGEKGLKSGNIKRQIECPNCHAFIDLPKRKRKE